MLAMQYSIAVPPEFTRENARERVQARKELFDALPGMLHKAFLFSATDQLYAPFYIWKSASAAQAFLLNDLFKGVTESFHRPRVRQWNVLALDTGRATTGRIATREADPVGPGPLNERAAEELARQKRLCAEEPGLHFAAIGLDPDRWEWVRYRVWEDAPPASLASDCVQTYDVLHISSPGE
jgi:hypothetical protein